MKTKKFGKTLILNKKTIANVDKSQLKDVKGGYHVPAPTYTGPTSCPNDCN